MVRNTTGSQERIKEQFQKPRAPTISLEANIQVNRCTSKKNPIWICASFNEIIYHQNCDEMAETVFIDNIKKSDSKVTQSDIDEMSSKYEVKTVAKHFQVLRVSNN